MNPVPTILTSMQAEHPSTIPTRLTTPPPPRNRSVLPDQLKDFSRLDVKAGYEVLDASLSPPNYYLYVSYYELSFEEFPKIRNAIKIDNKMTAKLQPNSINVPLPKWFTSQMKLQLTRSSMLLNFPCYFNSFDDIDDDGLDLLEELRSIKQAYYKTTATLPFLEKMIRFCLLPCFASTQAYRTLLKMFPMPSLSRLHSVTCGNIQSLKAI